MYTSGGMDEPQATSTLTTTSLLLIAALTLFICVPVAAGVTIGVVEHYMATTPADWPYPGSLTDRMNDFACALLLLPSGFTGRFYTGLVFFLIPMLIEMRRLEGWRVLFYAVCIVLPDNIALLYGIFSYGNTAYLMIVAFVFPMLIASWTSLAPDPLEKKLIRANLTVIWLIWLAADILLGFNFHSSYCKVSFILPISRP